MVKRILSVIFISILLTTFQRAASQELLDVVPTTKEEFIASEKKVLATIDWLEKTPFDSEESRRLSQKGLLVEWITKSPTVTLNLNAGILTFNKKNPDLIIIFMGGWTRYCLQNNYSKDVVQGSLAGVKSVINVYKSQDLIKDKEIDKLIKLDENEKLLKWVESKIKDK